MYKMIYTMSGYDHQDWTPVVIRSSRVASIARQSVQNPSGTKEFNKLNEDDVPILNKMTREQATALSQARAAKKMSQKELANALNMDVSIIKDYESCNVKNFKKEVYSKIMSRLGVKY